MSLQSKDVHSYVAAHRHALRYALRHAEALKEKSNDHLKLVYAIHEEMIVTPGQTLVQHKKSKNNEDWLPTG